MPTRYCWLVAFALVLAACAPQTPPVSVQTAVRNGAAEFANANGEYVLGSPNAAVTFVDYSDFL